MPKLIKKIGADGYMDPENSRTGDYLANICREITHKYNVDGIPSTTSVTLKPGTSK